MASNSKDLSREIDALVKYINKNSLDYYEIDSAMSRVLLDMAEPVLVEMALQLHPLFPMLHELWYAENSFIYEIKAGSKARNEKQSSNQQRIWMLCTLLAFSDGEEAVRCYLSDHAGNSDFDQMAIDCILQLLNDEPHAAIECYWQATKRKGNDTKYQLIGGMPALFYSLAVIKTKGPAAATEALEAFSQALSATCPDDRFTAIVEDLFQFVSLRDCDAAVGKPDWPMDKLPLDCPWRLLIRCACLHWMQITPSSSLVDRLMRFKQKAYDGGVYWYWHQADAMLSEFKDDAHVIECDLYGEASLLDLIDPIKNWQTRLQEIETVSVRHTGSNADGLVDQRFVWCCHVEGNDINLVPRLQKKTKKGTWTKGRKVNQEDLLGGYSRQDFLTRNDRRFCEILARTMWDSYRYFGRRQSLCIDRVEQFECLAKLGNVYRVDEHDNPSGIPMTIDLREPQLEVVSPPDGDSIHLKMQPLPGKWRNDDPFGEPDHWHLCWQSEDAVAITCFSDGQREIAELLGVEGLAIPTAAKERVLKTLQSMAPMITVLSDIGAPAFADLIDVAPDSTPHLELSPLQDGLWVELKFYPFGSVGPSVVPGQGGSTLMATIGEEARKTIRNINLEQQWAQKICQLESLGEPNDRDLGYSWGLADPAQALEMLDELQALKDDVVVDWPKGRKIATPRRVSSSSMRVKVGGDQDWLQIDGELQVSEDRVLQMDALLRLMDNARGRFVTLDDGSILALSQRLQTQLTALRGVSDDGKVHPLAAVVVDDSTSDMRVTGTEAWRERLARLREAASLEPEVPQALNAQLRDYQREGYEWLQRLAHWGAGACLADDMGLGKTLQSLAVVLQRASLGPTLIVAPTSVCNNWIDEIARFAPSLNTLRLSEGNRIQMIADCTAGDVLISSYGLLQNEIRELSQVQWATVVADEAQAFKNSQTRRSKAMMQLQADFRIITTGTPIENHLGELWNLFRFINPGLLGSRERFNERFAYPIEVHREETARDQLKALVRPFILRRLKRDVLTELPPRTEITQQIEFQPDEAAFYEAIRRQSLERISEIGAETDQRFQILAEITRLRQACCNPQLVLENSPVGSAKLRAFTTIVDELRENGHRCLVFSQFVGHLKLIRNYLDENSISYQYLDGSTPVKRRKKSVDDFQNGEGELFLISLKAGGSGLNLTAADYVIHMDPWWNPAVEDQASDRAHRLGQTRPVTIYRLVVKNTIEEKIVALHAEKRDLADGLLEGTETGARLSVDDLVQLLAAD